jgi:hypothetical protein
LLNYADGCLAQCTVPIFRKLLGLSAICLAFNHREPTFSGTGAAPSTAGGHSQRLG